MGKMFTFLVIISAVSWVLFVLVAALRLEPSLVSKFELARRSVQSKKELRRETLLPHVATLRGIVALLLLTSTTLLFVVTYGWGFGVIFSILANIAGVALAAVSFVSHWSSAIYAKYEMSVLGVVEHLLVVLRPFGGLSFGDVEKYRRFDSKEELLRMVAQAEGVLSEQERQVIGNTLGFSDKTVSSVMTPRTGIDAVNRAEFLGPLVLDELHAKGHSRLPVIEKDIDHVVGVLYLRDLLSLDEKRSMTVAKAMDKKVYYIHQDDTLSHALAALLKTHHHLCIVINDVRETVGLLTLEDVIEAMLGQQIIDEDDHTDPHIVAAQKKNNTPNGRVDL